ncbi:hypothetical protein GCM10007079_26770 [Nocardiopsis terrae]|uniref:DUF4349 domain-containing protein n=1 Tax=Nocardiopsis terrae TaxID=372655 RepID=A0ABR9HFA7_9ACTN|nr:DUF4349 domain-containing protein [Nocardiopsis terrae]MBE1457719.1 hypothetical protein [Nocardiopsis terrae]GHC84607.1 hypothetical protein GCM10007079_26770 [Nocardiopsis terrae]
MDTPSLPQAGRVAGMTVATGLAALLFTACGATTENIGAADGGGSSAEYAAESADRAAPGAQAEADAAEEDAGEGGVGSDLEVGDRQLVHTANMTVRVDDVAEAAELAKEMTLGADGYVANESLSTPAGGSPEGNLVLRIPNEDYEGALDGLAELGDRSELERSVEDVTEEVADVESRIESSETALETLRGYLEEAEDVDDLLRVESEIQQRQEELEAFQARLESLRNQTAYSTVHLTLVPPATYLEETTEESVGFLGGLERGWRALVGLGQGAAVAVGWLLPFAAVLAVLGAGPLWLWRRRRGARAASSAAAPADPASADTAQDRTDTGGAPPRRGDPESTGPGPETDGSPETGGDPGNDGER